MFEGKYLVYMIGAIQGIYQDKDGNKVLRNWREDLKKWSENKELPIIFLDPLTMEKEKTGFDPKEMMEKLKGWKRSGNWELYDKYSKRIWWGTPNRWGDYDSIVHSDFIVGYGTNDYVSPGTHKELGVAEFLNVPVYWVTTDKVTEIKDSTLMGVRLSGGEVFNNFHQLKEFILSEKILTKNK